MPIAYGFLILIILALIVEVLSIALKITGLDLKKARFQVISIITHTGFTTKESELITQHPARRKIAMGLMLISYVGTATLISVIISAFRTRQAFIYFTVYVAVILLIIQFLLQNKYIFSKFEVFLEKKLQKQMKSNLRYKSVEEVLKLDENYGVCEFMIDEGNELIGVSLEKSSLKENYIQVLNIDRGSHIVYFPKSSCVFQLGDRVVAYGKTENIRQFILNQRSNSQKDSANLS